MALVNYCSPAFAVLNFKIQLKVVFGKTGQEGKWQGKICREPE